ncbi:MAG: gliding motility-associated C-terminal domain-containing protein [Flavobacteriales bacterium]|nr:gliding motility-associated C-terminal domain-containing protein [Flavobacteriales bacterium]
MNSILQVWVPNAFTPDNDGRNDYFLPIVNGADPEDYKLLIFDRWGIEIFESEKIDEAWIGDVLGGDYYAQDGVYIWRIELKKLSDGEEKVFTGHVTLIR